MLGVSRWDDGDVGCLGRGNERVLGYWLQGWVEGL